jgi:uncharacterized protein YbjT (DUF2867 family)
MTVSRRGFFGIVAGAGATLMAARARAAASQPAPTVMVIGGTGRVGSIAVRRLIAAGIPVAFTTRSASNADMFGPGARGVVTDLNRRDGLERAFAGCSAAMMIIANGDDETTQGLNCVAAMREAGVQRLVYLSVARTVPHYVYKIPIERALEDWGVSRTILRPNYFDQFDLGWRRQIVDEGVYPVPIGLIGVNRIDCRDIVEVAFERLMAPRSGAGGASHEDVELHGPDALTGPTVAALYQAALGTPVRYVADLPEAERARYLFAGERGRKIAVFWEEGRAKASPEAVARTQALVGRPLRRFADFVPEAVALWRTRAGTGAG